MIQRFKNREDSEHEQAIIRLVVILCAFVYLYITYEITGKTENRSLTLIATNLYLVFGIVIFTIILFDQHISVPRRVIGIIGDTGIVSFALVVAGEIGAPLYGAYLWIIIANGFRFGKKYLYLAQIFSVAGFSYAIYTGKFWHDYPMFAAGLLIWLIVIPPYISLLLTRLEETAVKAKQADIAKSNFLANMSHELRTPLNAIIGYSELLEEETNEQGQTGYAKDLKKIRHSGSHLLGLINEILDLSKIEQGQMEIFQEKIDLNRLMDEVKTTIEPLAEKNTNQLIVNLQPGIGNVYSDVTKLRQILYNLLSNACKFTHKGVIALEVMQKVKNEQPTIVFTIKDNGVGIAPENIEGIFQPFKQESIEITKKFGGTGLGLTISKHFCEMLGGQLLLNSQKGQGSIFTVQLPMSLPQQ